MGLSVKGPLEGVFDAVYSEDDGKGTAFLAGNMDIASDHLAGTDGGVAEVAFIALLKLELLVLAVLINVFGSEHLGLKGRIGIVLDRGGREGAGGEAGAKGIVADAVVLALGMGNGVTGAGCTKTRGDGSEGHVPMLLATDLLEVFVGRIEMWGDVVALFIDHSGTKKTGVEGDIANGIIGHYNANLIVFAVVADGGAEGLHGESVEGVVMPLLTIDGLYLAVAKMGGVDKGLASEGAEARGVSLTGGEGAGIFERTAMDVFHLDAGAIIAELGVHAVKDAEKIVGTTGHEAVVVVAGRLTGEFTADIEGLGLDMAGGVVLDHSAIEDGGGEVGGVHADEAAFGAELTVHIVIAKTIGGIGLDGLGIDAIVGSQLGGAGLKLDVVVEGGDRLGGKSQQRAAEETQQGK